MEHSTASIVDEREYRLLREGVGMLSVNIDAVFEMRGEDCKAWLQGQATNDLRNLQPGGSLDFCICAPTGQLEARCTLWAMADRYIILTDRSTGPALCERVGSMVIMEDVELCEVTGDYTWLSAQGPGAGMELSRRYELPSLDCGLLGAAGLALRYDRTGMGGWDLLLPKDAEAPIGIASVSEEAVEVARLEAGIPRFGPDMNGKTLPPEMGPAFEAKHISYAKGCYTGQEVLMRIHSRGHTNRTWVALAAESPLAAGDRVAHGSREDAGIVTSAAVSPIFGPIAGAMLRNEVADPGGIVRVSRGSGSIRAEVRRMPLLEGRGFNLR